MNIVQKLDAQPTYEIYVFLAPDAPQNLTVHTTLTTVHTYQFNLTWDKPQINPNYYTILVADNINTSYKFNVSGSSTNKLLQPLRLPGNPIVRLFAFTNGGQSVTFKYINLKEVYVKVAGNHF